MLRAPWRPAPPAPDGRARVKRSPRRAMVTSKAVLDLAQVLVERAAQVGEALVVHRIGEHDVLQRRSLSKIMRIRG
jgi:hypothetical protein